MKKLTYSFIILSIIFFGCKKEEGIIVEEPIEDITGYNMLLMGHSFFKPYANRIGEIAIDANFYIAKYIDKEVDYDIFGL